MITVINTIVILLVDLAKREPKILLEQTFEFLAQQAHNNLSLVNFIST
jgi:hypothetical protein